MPLKNNKTKFFFKLNKKEKNLIGKLYCPRIIDNTNNLIEVVCLTTFEISYERIFFLVSFSSHDDLVQMLVHSQLGFLP